MTSEIDARALRSTLLALPELGDWPEVAALLPGGSEAVRLDWQLPVLAGRAVGAPVQAALPAAAAIACLQMSIMLVDDILDQDPRGEYHRLGYGRTANLALALQAAAFALLDRAPVALPARYAAALALARAALGTAFGQHLDVQNLHGEDNYWRVVKAKSTPFYGVALQSGALLGGAGPELAAGLFDLGALLGEIIQVFDDLLDAFAVPANPDWHEGRNNLALLYTNTAGHVDRARFASLLPEVGNPEVLAEAQRILIRSGAVSYCVYLLVERYQTAQRLLARLDLVDRAPLAELFARQMLPLVSWLDALGLPVPTGLRQECP